MWWGGVVDGGASVVVYCDTEMTLISAKHKKAASLFQIRKSRSCARGGTRTQGIRVSVSAEHEHVKNYLRMGSVAETQEEICCKLHTVRPAEGWSEWEGERLCEACWHNALRRSI